MWEVIAVIIFVACLLCWGLVRRRGQLAFWHQALRKPDLAYEFFKTNDVWRVFDEGLPPNFREHVPAGEWIGPFQMYVPKLGNRQVFVFGRKDTYRQSQVALLRVLQER